MTTSQLSEADNIPALLRAAQTCVTENRMADARNYLERVLALDSKNPASLRALAEIAMLDRNYDIAWDYAARAAQAHSTPANLLLLAQAVQATGRPEKALRYYGMVLKSVPDSVPALTGIAEIYEAAGYQGLMMKTLEKILETTPRDQALLQRIAKACPLSNYPRLMELYERERPLDSAPLDKRIEFQYRFAERRELDERLKRGLTPIAASPEDMGIHFAHDQCDRLEVLVDAALSQNPMDDSALAYKGMVALARGFVEIAERAFRICGESPTSVYQAVTLDEAFYRELEKMDQAVLFRGLPPLTEVSKQLFDSGPVIFLSCDSGYFFKFTRSFLVSINDVAPGSQVHVHIMNATGEELREAASFCADLTQTKIALSAEDASHITTDKVIRGRYFHAIRFLRMLQYLEHYQRPLWLMDVDALMNRDPRSIIGSPKNADVMLFGHAGRLMPWLQFNASVVGIQPNAQGTRYLRLVAAYISHYWSRQRLWWGIDQMALYGVFTYLRRIAGAPTINMLPPYMLDNDYTPEGIIWGNGTSAKFLQFRPLSGMPAPPDSPRLRYMAALEKYTPRT